MTMLSRWNPLRDVSQLERGLFGPGFLMNDDMSSSAWLPSVDVAEDANSVVVRAEVPGMKLEDFDIRFDNGMLTVSGERKQESQSEERTWHRVERSYGRFSRTFMLPTSVDAEKANASYTNGILEIVIPKREEAKPKRIPVTSGVSESHRLKA